MGVDVSAVVMRPTTIASGNGYYLARDPWEHLVGSNREWTEKVVMARDMRERLDAACAMVDEWPAKWNNGNRAPEAREMERFKESLREFVEQCEDAELQFGPLTIQVSR